LEIAGRSILFLSSDNQIKKGSKFLNLTNSLTFAFPKNWGDAGVEGKALYWCDFFVTHRQSSSAGRAADL
jgi:hypothetical protein